MTQHHTPTGTNTDATTDGPLIASDRVAGTEVFDPTGKHIGTVKRLMIDKISGRVAYAVMGFGGFLGLNQDLYPVPWDTLDYDPSLGGYRTNITEEQLNGAPALQRLGTAGGTATDTGDFDWSDRSREQQLHDYYHVAYYWDDDD